MQDQQRHDASSSTPPPLGRRRRRRQRMQNQNHENHPAVNVIVASDAGKPIFARFGTPAQIARICGLLQALRCSMIYDVHLGNSNNNNKNNNNNNPLGDLHSIQSGSSLLVFMHVESIWLVAIAKTNNNNDTSLSSSIITQAYLRLELEYIYSQLIFHVTDQVQAMFQHNASFDLQSILGTGTGTSGTSSSSSSSIHGLMNSLLNQADVFISTTKSDVNNGHDNDDKQEEDEEEEEHEVVVLENGDEEEPIDDGEDGGDDDDWSRRHDDMAINNHNIVNNNNNNNNPAPFLSSSTPTLFPLSNHVREKTSEILQVIGQEETQHCVFSILFTTTANNNNCNKKEQQQHHSSSSPACCKLLTCVQPSFRPHQLRTTDLNLLMHFCSQQLENNHCNHSNQASSSSAELWLPVCLPRFHSSGFLYCYTTRLEMTTGSLNKNDTTSNGGNNHYLTLALVSQMGSTEQFQLFRTAATRIRHELGLPMQKESPVLTILSTTTSSPTLCSSSSSRSNVNTDQVAVKDAMVQQESNNQNDNSDDVASRRSFDNDEEDDNPTRDDDGDKDVNNDASAQECHHHHDNNDEDYVDASGDGNGIIPYVGTTTTDSVVPTFCEEIQRAMDPLYVQEFVTKQYLRDLIIATSSSSSKSSPCKQQHNKMFVRHFLFRFNAPIRIMSCMNDDNNTINSRHHFLLWNNRNSSTSCTNNSTTMGHLTQCISSWLGNNDEDEDDDFIHLQNKIWSRYQKLNLRLRLGSASFESVLGAWDMISNDATGTTTTTAADTTGGDTNSSRESINSDNKSKSSRSSSPGIGCHCPAMGLLESPPNFINGLIYIVDGKETYLGMNGQDFELYVVLSLSSSSSICDRGSTSGDKRHHAENGRNARSIPVQQGAALAARLARRLLLDQDKLFIAKPFTWKQS